MVDVAEVVGHAEAPPVGVAEVVLDEVVDDPVRVDVWVDVVDVAALVALVVVVVGGDVVVPTVVVVVVVVLVVGGDVVVPTVVVVVVVVGGDVVVPAEVLEVVLVGGHEPVLVVLLGAAGRAAARTGWAEGGPTNGVGAERTITERGSAPAGVTVRISRSTSAR